MVYLFYIFFIEKEREKIMKTRAITKRVLSVLLAFAMIFTSVNISSIETYAAARKYVKVMKVSKAKITMNEAENKAVKVTIKTKGKASKKFTVKSSNKKIATASVKKNKVVIKGKKAGSAKITVKTKGKNRKGKKIKKIIRVIVKKKVSGTPASSTAGNGGQTSNNSNQQGNTNLVDQNKYYTRGEWIKLLGDMFGFAENSTLSVENYEFADTKEDKEYGYLAEVANVYGILPECDSEGYEDPEQDVPLFESSKIVTREYAAYTIVQALGFEPDDSVTLEALDADNAKYAMIDGMAVSKQLINLVNNRFKPSAKLSEPDGKQMLAKAQDILDSAVIDSDKKINNVTYQSGVTDVSELNSDNVSVDSLSEQNYRVTIPKDEDTENLKTGDIFVLPEADGYVSDTAYKVEEIESSTDDEMTILCSKPDIEEVVSDVEYEGAVEPEQMVFEPADGVKVEQSTSSARAGIYKKIGIDSTITPGSNVTLSVSKSIGDIDVKGKVDISIPKVQCKVKADVRWSGVKFNEFLVSMTEKIKIGGELSYTLAETGYELTNSEGNTTWSGGNIEIGRIPIPIGGGLSFDVVFFWQLNAKGTIEIAYSIEATEGLQLVDGSLRTIKDFKQNLDTLSLKGSFKVGLGINLVIDAFDLIDLVGVDFSFGLCADASFEPHPLLNLYCCDAKLYLYGESTLSQETALGKFLDKVAHVSFSWTIFDEENSPFKVGIHIENGQKVDECTYGAGAIEGKVVDQNGDSIVHARIQLYKHNILMQSKYSESEGAFKFEDLTEGEYLLVVSATGNSKYESTVTVQRAQTTYMEAFIMLDRKTNVGEGCIEGEIINAVSGNRISDVAYEVRENWNNTTGTVVESGTADGNYEISLNPGNYTIQFIANGYVNTEMNVAIYSDSDIYKTVALSPELVADDDLMRIVLTWGENPDDLDSHLIGPTFTGDDNYHIYFSEETYYDYDFDGTLADLDLDDTDSYGPETITIHTLNSDGIYHYYVHDYSNRDEEYSTEMSYSNAQVRVYRGKTLLQKFNVPTNSDGTLWHVFDYDAASDTIIPINLMSYEYSPSNVGEN